jgi:5-methylcytosine-specific restriction enzyme B
MREVHEGDIVFHFTDNEALTGLSIAGSAADDSFIGIAGTEWAARPAYRIPLRDYQRLDPPITRAEFLNEPNYRETLENLLETERGLFFNREFNLNQGSYLTEAPLKLVQIWNDIYRAKTGKPIPDERIVPPLTDTRDGATRLPVTFDNIFLAAFSEAVAAANLRMSQDFLRRFLASLAAKPFLILTGTSGSGKTKLAQATARWLTSGASDYQRLIPVGADWTGNDNIVGYPDGLDDTNYIGKPALELIWHAAENPERPHFLILDEMNLSHVERYFADLLSAIESKEEIPLYSGSPRNLSGKELPKALRAPENVFIIGTVNVDETTYMFSPKVLDRANVLEFRVDVEDIGHYFAHRITVDLSSITGRGVAFGETLLRTIEQPVQIPSALKPRFESEMLLFFNILKAHGAEFGYRVAHEASRFLFFYHELSKDDAEWFERGFDAVIIQKFLPKLHGQRTRLAPLLRKLWFVCITKEGERGANVLKRLDEVSRSVERNVEPSIVPEAAPYPKSGEKIARMWRVLNENGFASFAEA